MIPRLTEEQIKTLAEDTYKDKIFWGQYCPEDIPMVFMIISLGGLDHYSEEDKLQIGDVYEYMEKAEPRSVNGMPCFLSYHFVHREDIPLIWEKFKKIKEAIEAI